MCGRFARYSLSRELERYFNAHPPSFEILPNYNVAPTQEIPVIIRHEEDRHIKKRHWGLVPFWAKDISIGMFIFLKIYAAIRLNRHNRQHL